MSKRAMPEPRFLIRHPDGREYALADYAFFQREYEPNGFVIVDPAPNGHIVPALLTPERPPPAKKTTTKTLIGGEDTPPPSA